MRFPVGWSPTRQSPIRKYWVPTEPSAQIAISTALGRVMTDSSIARGLKCLDRMPAKMRVMAMRDAAARDRAITHTPEFIRFGIEHQEVVQ
jgi:hypothetical protein